MVIVKTTQACALGKEADCLEREGLEGELSSCDIHGPLQLQGCKAGTHLQLTMLAQSSCTAWKLRCGQLKHCAFETLRWAFGCMHNLFMVCTQWQACPMHP